MARISKEAEAGKSQETANAVEKAAVPAGPRAVREPEYTVDEFAANAARIFGEKANSDIVHAAFMVEGLGKATLSQAKGIVGGFMRKEVK